MGARSDDAVERALIFPAIVAIAGSHGDGVIAKPPEVIGGPVGKLWHDLDAVDTIDQFGEHRGPVAARPPGPG